jgi:cytochrome P450
VQALETPGVLPFHRMPEPPRGGLGGHLSEWLGVENAKDVLSRLRRYAEACGPLARVTLGPVRMVVVSDAALAAQLLDDPRANFKGASYILTRAVLDNVLLLNGKAWEDSRKAYRAALKEVDAEGAARVVVDRFVTRAAPGPLALDLAVSKLVGDVVGRFVAGVELTPELEPHRRRVQYELAGLGIDLQCQPWTYLSPMRWLRLRRSVDAARAFFRESVERRLRAPDPSAKDILNGFIALADAGGHPKDAESIQEGVVNFFFTAHDVLASSTTFCLWLLAGHADVQRRLAASLAEGDGGEELGHVVREALRLFPGYALFGRTLQRDIALGGYEVPRGTMIIVSPFVTHRLERYWPRAAAFDPDRWAPGAAPITPSAKGHYLPFGSGARGCLASHVAVPVMKVLVAEIVRAFDIEARPGHEPKIAYWGTAYSENGLPVRITPRAGRSVPPSRSA